MTILELREKVEKAYDTDGEPIKEVVSDDNNHNEDAVIALMSLGFTKTECVNVVKSAYKEGKTTIEEIIAYSLKHIK